MFNDAKKRRTFDAESYILVLLSFPLIYKWTLPGWCRILEFVSDREATSREQLIHAAQFSERLHLDLFISLVETEPFRESCQRPLGEGHSRDITHNV